MAFEVETGTGSATATSYITTDYLSEVADNLGEELGDLDQEAAANRGTAWLDATFGSRYSGTRTNGRVQALGYPRTGSTDKEGNEIPSDEIPREIKYACAVASIYETRTANALITPPDAAIKREKIGELETEYATSDTATASTPWFPTIEGILAPLLGNVVSPYGAAWYWA